MLDFFTLDKRGERDRMQVSFFLDRRGKGTESRVSFSYKGEGRNRMQGSFFLDMRWEGNRVPSSWIGDGMEMPDSIDNLLALLCCYRQVIKTNDYSLVTLFSFGANLFIKHIVFLIV